MNNPTYTFVSVSTAKPGKLEDLVRIAKSPTMKMDKKSDGLIAYQVSVDKERNSVVVWATYDKKETLYNFLQTEQGNNTIKLRRWPAPNIKKRPQKNFEIISR